MTVTKYALRYTNKTTGTVEVEHPDSDGDLGASLRGTDWTDASDRAALEAAVLTHNAHPGALTTVELLEGTFEPVVIAPALPTAPGVYVTTNALDEGDPILYVLDAFGTWHVRWPYTRPETRDAAAMRQGVRPDRLVRLVESDA